MLKVLYGIIDGHYFKKSVPLLLSQAQFDCLNDAL